MEFTRNLNVSTAPVMLQIINYKLYDIIWTRSSKNQ